MVRQCHQHNGHEPEQNPGDSEGWGPWGTAVHVATKVRHGLATEQQQE